MQSTVLALAFSLGAMGCHHCSRGGHGLLHRHATYSSCYSGGCYGGSYMAGYSQGWPSPAYSAPMAYSGVRYRAASGQMANYAPMTSGYAMPIRGYSYGSATPMTYGTPGMMSYGTPGMISNGTLGTST